MKNVIFFKGADIAGGDTTVVYGLDMEVHEGDLV